MKKKRCIPFFTLLIGTFLMWACSDSSEGDGPIQNQLDQFPLNIQIANTDLPESATCMVYVFGKSGESASYILKNNVTLTGNTPLEMIYVPADWSDTDYRFLFITMPDTDAGITLEGNSGSELAIGTELWENLRIKTDDPLAISGDCWYAVVDESSANIASTRIITGELERLVGQMVIDIYRVDDSNVAEDIQNAEFFSVLDRVYEMDFEYTGLTTEISFDANGEIVVENMESGMLPLSAAVYSNDDQWRVTIPTEENEMLELAAIGSMGSARIKGLYCLPSDGNIRLKTTFHYYDTTPACGSGEHLHTLDCYKNDKTIEVNLPQEDAVTGLSIFSNKYTVNKAAIRYDRIIDIGVGNTLNFDIDWD